MNYQSLTPFIGSVIRHALVAGGVIELSKADETSSQLASSLVTLVGIAWSFYNAHKSKKTAEVPKSQ